MLLLEGSSAATKSNPKNVDLAFQFEVIIFDITKKNTTTKSIDEDFARGRRKTFKTFGIHFHQQMWLHFFSKKKNWQPTNITDIFGIRLCAHVCVCVNSFFYSFLFTFSFDFRLPFAGPFHSHSTSTSIFSSCFFFLSWIVQHLQWCLLTAQFQLHRIYSRVLCWMCINKIQVYTHYTNARYLNWAIKSVSVIPRIQLKPNTLLLSFGRDSVK